MSVASPHIGISIHAPREGGDPYFWTAARDQTYFNPRPPRGGRLNFPEKSCIFIDISIHAPCEGGDV